MNWLFVLLALIGNFLIIRKNVVGFFLWVIADGFFFMMNAYSRDFDQAAVFAINMFMAIYGLLEWSDKDG